MKDEELRKVSEEIGKTSVGKASEEIRKASEEIRKASVGKASEEIRKASEEIRKASEQLLQGGIILYPTDTLWGIGCDATDSNAVDRIYRIKKRSDSKSMLVLVDGIPMLERHLEEVPREALEVLEKTSKPTTIIYPGARNLAQNLVAGDGSVGIRIPSDPFCLELIRAVDLPIVSTSANISGKPAPRIYTEIDPEIVQGVDYVVNWRREEDNPASPSTVIRIDPDGRITVLRP